MLLANAALVPAFRGEDVDDVLAEVANLIGTSQELSLVGNMQEARGAAALAAGRLGDAMAEYRKAAQTSTSVNGTDNRMSASHAAFWEGDIAEAAVELDAIIASGYRAPTVEARESTIRAGLAAAGGRKTEALALYRDAIRRWRDLGLVLDEALAGIDMVTLLDVDEPEVRAVAENSRAILERLGAKPLLARLDAAMTRPSSSVATPEPTRTRDASNV